MSHANGVRNIRPGLHPEVEVGRRSRCRAHRPDGGPGAGEGGRQGRLQVHLGQRAPLPPGVLPPLGQRCLLGLSGPRHRAGPHRFGHLQPVAPGQPPGQGGRTGGHARPSLRQPVRVRHRPRRRQPRDPRLPPRHGRPERDQGDLGGRHRRVPQNVAAGRVPGLPGQVLVAAPPQNPAQALGTRSPGHVVRRRQHLELRDGGPQGPRGTGLLRRLHPRPRGGPGQVQEGHRQRRADRCLRQRQRDGHARRPSSPRTSEAGYQKCLDAKLNYLQSNVFRYHDTFPHPEGVPFWPDTIPDLDLPDRPGHGRRGCGHCG